MIQLKGLTWDHARGHEPLLAASSRFEQEHPGIAFDWEQHPLRAFRPEHAEAFDLLVLDAPRIEAARRQGLLLPLDEPDRAAELEALAQRGIGPSPLAFRANDRTWALPIDAAAQVACYRPDLLDRVPSRWADVIALAEAGRALWPLNPAEAMDSFCTLAANIGHALASTAGGVSFDPAAARRVLRAMHAVSRHLPSECFQAGSLDTLQALAQPTEQQRAYCPLVAAFSNYSRPRYRRKRIAFIDMPGLGDTGPVGSVFSGTGVAVSARSTQAGTAVAFAFRLASEGVQKGLYVDHQGQPAHAAAWADEHANQVCTHFFRMTRRTLEASWLPPRDAGFAAFLEAGGPVVGAFLQGELGEDETLRRLGVAARTGRPAGQREGFDKPSPNGVSASLTVIRSA